MDPAAGRYAAAEPAPFQSGTVAARLTEHAHVTFRDSADHQQAPLGRTLGSPFSVASDSPTHSPRSSRVTHSQTSSSQVSAALLPLPQMSSLRQQHRHVLPEATLKLRMQSSGRSFSGLQPVMRSMLIYLVQV